MLRRLSYLTWLSFRMISQRGVLFDFSTWVSVFGVAIGVAALFVSMAVVSGFETTLSQILADVSGHVRVVIRPSQISSNEIDIEAIESQLTAMDSRIQSWAKVTSLEAVIAAKGRMSGVLAQGLEVPAYKKVLALEKRSVAGHLNLESGQVALGKSLASRLGVHVGDRISLVVPIPHELDPTQFERIQKVLYVSAILDLGKYEFDNRLALLNLKDIQEMLGDGRKFQGWILRTDNLAQAREIAHKVSQKLGPAFYVSDWREINENLFEAVRVERVIIFFVVLLILVAASMNISSTMYIHVIRRIKDISLMRSFGHKPRDILVLITVQGLMVCALGLTGGLILGKGVGVLLEYIQEKTSFLPQSVYKISIIHLDYRWDDLTFIGLATFAIALISCGAPALRASRLPPAEGLKYE